jgi:hypothetical protein
MNAGVAAGSVVIFIQLQLKPMAIKSSFRLTYSSSCIDKVQVSLGGMVKYKRRNYLALRGYVSFPYHYRIIRWFWSTPHLQSVADSYHTCTSWHFVHFGGYVFTKTNKMGACNNRFDLRHALGTGDNSNGADNTIEKHV